MAEITAKRSYRRAESADPKDFQFDLPLKPRPRPAPLAEEIHERAWAAAPSAFVPP